MVVDTAARVSQLSQTAVQVQNKCKMSTNFISNAQFTLNLSIENDTDILQKKTKYLFCLQLVIEYQIRY